MAIELDEDYVEARANLGCVLAETGQRDLAVAAFEGALRFHGDYADVHYHLARTLDEIGQADPGSRALGAFFGLGPRQSLGGRGRASPGTTMRGGCKLPRIIYLDFVGCVKSAACRLIRSRFTCLQILTETSRIKVDAGNTIRL